MRRAQRAGRWAVARMRPLRPLTNRKPRRPLAPRRSPSPVRARRAAAKPEGSKSAGSKGWAVQLGVFGSRENAERLAKQVKGSGFTVLINETSGKDGKKLYWVRVGPEAEAAAAAALSARLKAAG